MGTWKTFDVRGASAETQAHNIVHAAIEAGVTLFDWSPI
jgi:aryl-alcohol dehydrogenase-like predicted oxidoreductase